MDDNFRELEREAFESAFKGEEEKSSSTDAGYGLDPRQADTQAMADAFNGADVAVGGPNPELEIEADPLPAPSGDAVEPSTEGESAKPADPVADAKPQTPQFKTFGQAFKHYRQLAANGGPKTFEWNGKKFTTQLKSEVLATRKASKPTPTKAPAGQTLAQAKGDEYTQAWQQAQKTGSHADKLKAEQALQTAEAAASAQKEGKSVVVKRQQPGTSAVIMSDVMKQALPDPTSTEFADTGKRFPFKQ